MNLTQWAFVLFAAGAVGGISLAALRAAGVRFPRWFAGVHGLLGLVALVTLLIADLRGGAATQAVAWWAFGFFATALLGGVVLFRRNAPLPLFALHGALALAGLYLLYRGAFLA